MHFHISKLDKESRDLVNIFWILKEIDAKIISITSGMEQIVVVNDDKTLWHHLPAAYFYPIIIKSRNISPYSKIKRYSKSAKIDIDTFVILMFFSFVHMRTGRKIYKVKKYARKINLFTWTKRNGAAKCLWVTKAMAIAPIYTAMQPFVVPFTAGIQSHHPQKLN